MYDEVPAMTLQDIKWTDRRTKAQMDNVETVYHPQTKFVRGIDI